MKPEEEEEEEDECMYVCMYVCKAMGFCPFSIILLAVTRSDREEEYNLLVDRLQRG